MNTGNYDQLFKKLEVGYADAHPEKSKREVQNETTALWNDMKKSNEHFLGYSFTNSNKMGYSFTDHM